MSSSLWEVFEGQEITPQALLSYGDRQISGPVFIRADEVYNKTYQAKVGEYPDHATEQ